MIHVCEENGKYIGTYEGPDIPETMPTGAFAVDVTPTHQDAVWDGVKWVDPVVPITSTDVNDERNRRIYIGTSVDISGYGLVALSGSGQDMVNLQGLAFGAQQRIDAGDTVTTTPFRDNTDVVHDLSPPQLLELWNKGSTFVSACYQTAWEMKDTGIPDDYTADIHWPT